MLSPLPYRNLRQIDACIPIELASQGSNNWGAKSVSTAETGVGTRVNSITAAFLKFVRRCFPSLPSYLTHAAALTCQTRPLTLRARSVCWDRKW